MSPVSQEAVDQVRKTVHEALAGRASGVFMNRIDAILADWGGGKLTAAQACEKVQKVVGLFLSEDLAKEIGGRCAPIVMRESALKQ